MQALQFLTDLGGLRLQDGDTNCWVAGQDYMGEPAEVIYEFTEMAPRLLANFAYENLDTAARADHRHRACGRW